MPIEPLPDSPARRFWREHGARALPFSVGVMVTAALVLTIGWGVNGAEGFGVALGLVGTAAAVLAAVDAHISAARVERAVESARSAAAASEAASNAARAASDEARALTADLAHADRARRRKHLRVAVQNAAARLALAHQYSESDPSNRLDAVGLLSIGTPIAEALEASGHLPLTACRALVMELVQVAGHLTPLVPLTDEEPRASPEQLTRLVDLARAAFQEVKPGAGSADDPAAPVPGA